MPFAYRNHFRAVPALALAWLGCSAPAPAQPELSTGPGQPIEFDSERGALVASGDAQLRDGPVLIRADEIGFYQQEQRAEAVGNVEVTREGLRLLADRIDYHFETEAFEGTRIRAGVHPVYIQSEALSGTPADVTLDNAQIWLGEPDPWGLNIRADRLNWNEDSGIAADRPVFRFGKIPFLALPYLAHSLDSFPLRYSGGVGYRSNLGAYLRNEAAVEMSPGLFLGANVDGYTRRGILTGPIADWTGRAGDWDWESWVNTGYINDTGPRGLDRRLRPIDNRRYWVETRQHVQHARDFTFNAALSWWSDSEVTRDFRPDFFFENQSPDSYAEASWFAGPVMASLFARGRPNDFQVIRERMPELRIDLTPTRLTANSGIYQSGAVSYTRLRRRDPRVGGIPVTPPPVADPTDIDNQRIDAHYTLERPIRLAKGVTLTPRAAARLTHYEETLFNQGSTRRFFGELGFDLEGVAHATWDYRNPIWKIDGLRHRVRPVMQYRYLPRIDDNPERPVAIDTPVFGFTRLPVNLNTDRQIDAFAYQRHLVRLGVENVLQTRHEDYGSRDLARLNLYQDINLELEPGQDRLESFWTELELQPAPWLEFALFSRSLAQDLTLSEFNTRLRLTDADVWSLGLATQYLDGRIDQLFLEYSYQVTRRFGFDMILRWDRRLNTLTEQFYGLTQQLGNAILLTYGIRVRDGSTREDDLNFTLNVSILDF